MDRFIGQFPSSFSLVYSYLKSNMDRFIDLANQDICNKKIYLKSNMDRFIDCYINYDFTIKEFKIQYG